MVVDTLSWVGKSLAGGRYRVAALLGEGGMGSVFRAHDANLNAEVVIKVPKPGLLADPNFAPRFGREVRSLVRLAHAHIVRILDVGEHQGLPFAVMQFLAGGSLRQRLESANGAGTAAALADLPSWLPDVADALDYIHSQGYVHRDVKPDNILFDAAGQVYLGDFGIAKALAGSEGAGATPFRTVAGLVIGTPQYMAPELMAGGAASGAADQYALAVTVYEAVCGRLPFDGATAVALAVQHATRPAPPPHEVAAGVPLALSAALLRGLCKEPAGRFPDCRSLAQALLVSLQASPRPFPATLKEASGAVQAVPAAPPASAVPAVTVDYSCPSCGRGFRLPPQPEGKQLRCRSCGTTFKVRPPLGDARTDTDAVVSAKVQTAPPAPAVPGGGGQERFTCPHCSAALRLPAEKRGRSTRCPRCKKTFVAGGIDRRSDVSAAVAADPAVRPSKQKGATARLAVGAFGVVVLLAVAVASAVWLFPRIPSPTAEEAAKPTLLPDAPPTKKPVEVEDEQLLQGRWRCVREQGLGKDGAAADVTPMDKRLEAAGDRLTISRTLRGKVGVYDGRFRLTPGATPKRFDWQGIGPQGTSMRMVGIYELSKDKLRLCYRVGPVSKELARPEWKDILGYGVVCVDFERSGGARPAPPADERPPAKEAEWIPLFNGKDLTGWRVRPEESGNWKVQGGVLIGSGPGRSHLFTQRSERDFHLRVEAKINDGGNSGVYFRARYPDVNRNDYEANIYSPGKKSPRRYGILYRSGKTVVADKEGLVPPDQWFTMEVIAEGNHIVVKVDGKTTVDYVDPQPISHEGAFALQQHDPQTVVYFRKVEIKVLTAR